MCYTLNTSKLHKKEDLELKKLLIFLTMILLSISLFSCSGPQEKNQYTVRQGSTIFTIDLENNTISDGSNLYHYTVSSTGSGYKTEITYPDGSTYWWQADTTGGGGYGGWSDDYDETRYASGDLLCEMLELDSAAVSRPKNLFMILLLLIIGLFNLISPRKAWYLQRGWLYKDAKPSDMALGMHRFIGAVALVLAVVMIII